MNADPCAAAAMMFRSGSLADVVPVDRVEDERHARARVRHGASTAALARARLILTSVARGKFIRVSRGIRTAHAVNVHDFEIPFYLLARYCTCIQLNKP